MIVVRRYSNNVKLKKTKVTLTEDTKIKVDGKPKTLIAGGKILLSRKMEVIEDEKKEKKKKNEGKIDPFLGYEGQSHAIDPPECSTVSWASWLLH